MCRYGHHWLFLRIDNKLKSMFGANFFLCTTSVLFERIVGNVSR